jgi:hypothetical protein
MQIQIGHQMIDITNPDHRVEIQIRGDGQVIWVNVDGICRLRICQIEPDRLKVIDERLE